MNKKLYIYFWSLAAFLVGWIAGKVIDLHPSFDVLLDGSWFINLLVNWV